MKTILKAEIKHLQREYGIYMYLIPLFQLGQEVIYLLEFMVCGIMGWFFINRGFLTQSVYEQLSIILFFMLIFLFKKEKSYVLVPFITKLPISKIGIYTLIRELFSRYNFMLWALVIPVFFLANTIEFPDISYIILSIRLIIIGLLMNLLTRIIKYFCVRYKLFRVAIFGVLFINVVVLLCFYRTETVFSYSNYLGNIRFFIVLLAIIALLIPAFFYVVKQELYQAYDGNHLSRKSLRSLDYSFLSNIFSAKYYSWNISIVMY
ncbi:MAG: hypothetical protein LBR13_04820 [Dysgonamonadaceae bacterium]|jgi:hypothetical protein|nr:hypothetical protein [Dysgonamonadaceae bacterium]